MDKRERNDIFRVLDEETLWTAGQVENSRRLLEKEEMQISLAAHEPCILKNEKGEKASILLDYGIEIHGGISLLAWLDSTKRGAKVRVRFGESAAEAMSELGGKTNATNDHARRDLVVEVGMMSMNPIGETGFRFVRIDLLEPEAVLVIKSICAVMVYKDVPYRGSFSCSDPLLNRIWDVGAYTVHLNMQEYIWDGIKRDRLVWVGDMHPEVTTIKAVFGEDDAVEKSLDFIRKETPLPGWMNNMASYSMWYVIIVHDWFFYTGKKEFLEKQKDYLKGVADLLSAHIDEKGQDTVKEGRFLDWPSEGKKKIVEDLKRLRSYETDPEDYKQAAALLVMVGAKDAKEANEKLLKTGGAKGMSTFMGYYILTARAMAGDYEGCLEAIREYWGGMLSLGATTFWEDFDVDWMKDAARIDELPKEGQIDVHGAYGRFCYKGYRHSLCHGWASGVTPWLSENVLGVKILEPGCKKIKVEPHLGDLEWAKGTYPTPYGEITVSHVKQADGSIETTVDAPEEIEVL